jgi:predicted ATP-dependent protease
MEPQRTSVVLPSPDSADRWQLTPAELDTVLRPEELGFRSTDELQPLDRVIGQDRAVRALLFGLAMRQRGYNVFVSGMVGSGKKHLVKELLEERARQEPVPNDWVYVHNFDEPDRPLAFSLAAGQGTRLRTALEEVLDRLAHDLPKALKAKDFDAERERLSDTYGQRSEELFNDLVTRARELQMGVRRLPNGVLVFVPLKGDKAMEPGEIEALTDEEKADIASREQELGECAAELMAKQQELSRELRREVEEIVRAFARRLIEPLLDGIKKDVQHAGVKAWLERVRDHLLRHLQRFQGEKPEATDLPTALRAAMGREDPFLEYRVHVVVDNSRAQGAPVVVEISPNYKNLFGTIERDVNLFGHLSTDFTHIKPGSLLRANGGYLVFDLDDAITEPLVWKQLKQALKSGQLLTDIYEPFGLFSTLALKPQPIPITTKIVVLGSPELFYLLQFYDNDFRDLFKVRADFGPETERSVDNQHGYARFIAKLARAEGLLSFQADAVVEVIRFGMREAADREKLTVELGQVADLVYEANHWAHTSGASAVVADHVRQALEERVHRSDRIAAKVRELIAEDVLKVAVEGRVVGQINGLSLWDLGDSCFGRPSRVTASAGVGQEGLLNIERESDLSGPTHDKGVLILEGYLRNKYARQHPLALSASLTFEQSYGGVEGDSASSAELYCLLSALADIPLRQDIAVTGSINQHGKVQAVGAVNEKIEGFFEVCKIKGLTGTQGVLIPRSNIRHLVLRPDVIQAVKEKRFHIWAIDTTDEGIELLTGMAPGDIDQAESFHFRVDQRLQEMLAILQEQPTAAGPARVRLGTGAAPRPTPPPLPGETRERPGS